MDHIHDSDKSQKPTDVVADDDDEMHDKLTRITRIAREPWPKKLDDMCELMEEFKEYISPEQAISKSFLKNDGLMERLSRYEQRLELSIHRNMKQLEKVKKQTQANADSRKMYCPFVSQEFYDELHEQIEEYKAEQDRENEPTDEEQEQEEQEEQATTKSAKKTRKSEKPRQSAQHDVEFDHPKKDASPAIGEGNRDHDADGLIREVS